MNAYRPGDPDYHGKPLLAVRVPAESAAWARQEAKRRGQSFGDFMDGLITAERQRVTERDARLAAIDAMTPEDFKRKRREMLEYTERNRGLMSPAARAELAGMRAEEEQP